MGIKERIKFDKYTCEDEYGRLTKFDKGYREISLYIVFGYKCNADCVFCVYHSKTDKEREREKECLNTLNLESLEKMLIDIANSGFYISTVHLTGGEPTLDIKNFTRALILIRKHLGKLVEISVNTDGIHLKELGNLVEAELLNNIALSRHGLTDQENREIFKTDTIPTDEDIKQFVLKYGQVIHLSCNLIKGCIDTPEKVVEYIEKAGELGINDIGLVSLMNKNEYCKERYVEYKDISTELEKLGFVRTRQHIKRDKPCKIDEHGNKCGDIICKCENYLYNTQQFKMVQMYHRFVIKSNNIESYLVYVNNELKQGFSGDTINKY